MTGKFQIINERVESFTAKRGKVEQRIISLLDLDMFGGISRASVHNRMEDEKLTAFLFEIKKGTKTGITEGRDTPYIYVPVSELKGWAEEIKKRGIDRGKIAPSETELPKKGWAQDFLAWKKKRQRKGD